MGKKANSKHNFDLYMACGELNIKVKPIINGL